MDLWNAEVRGTVTTDKGTITFRSFIHTHEMALLTDLSRTGGEAAATLAWETRPCVDHRNVKRFDDPPNPPSSTCIVNGVNLCTQVRYLGCRSSSNTSTTADPNNEARGNRNYGSNPW